MSKSLKAQSVKRMSTKDIQIQINIILILLYHFCMKDDFSVWSNIKLVVMLSISRPII